MPNDLIVDPNRVDGYEPTGIYVRATLNGKWGSYDIVELDKQSLLTWLRSGGGANPLAEAVVWQLLGHQPD